MSIFILVLFIVLIAISIPIATSMGIVSVDVYKRQRMRCVLTPGHTVGVMSHFWTLMHGERRLNVGIYGGAGFSSVSREALLENGLPLTLQQDFLNSIEKVWDEPVDIMLGNHPFHNDTYQKYERLVAGEEDAFVDPGEWHRFLSELKQKYQEFLKKTPDQVKEMYAESQMLSYYGRTEAQEEKKEERKCESCEMAG